MKFGFWFVAGTWIGVPICAALGLSVQGAVMYASGVTVGILVSRFAAKDAEIARLCCEFIEATDENFIWGAMDNVHDADTTLDDYAAAVSRAQRAVLARVKGGAA